MVVLGDGYTATDMPKFRAHLDKHLNILWSIEPFRSYRNYINVYAVEIVSGESGITCDPEIRERRNTPLGMEFGGGCTNINARGITIPQDKQEITRKYAAMATPHFDQILVIANTDTYGGIGGRLATTSGGNSLGPLITPHELGHSLGGLTDEYTYSARGKPGGAFTGGEPGSIHMTTAQHRGHADEADQVVSLARRAERVWREDRALRGRLATHHRRVAAEQALDDDLRRLLLRSGQPRAHDAADLAASRADRCVDADPGARRPHRRAVDRDGAPRVPRADDDLGTGRQDRRHEFALFRSRRDDARDQCEDRHGDGDRSDALRARS